MQGKFDTVIFDLDGTLVDTAPDLLRVLNSVLREHGRPDVDDTSLRAMVGDGARVLMQRGFAATGGWPDGLDEQAAFDTFMARYLEAPAAESAVFPGIVAVLERLHATRCGLGVCTNKPQAPSELILEALDLRRFFAATVGGDVLPVRKPDPAHVQAVIDALDGTRARTVFVGDSINDVRAAKAAGIPCVLVSFGYSATPVGDLGGDMVIDHFDDLIPALAELSERA
ncbi:MAG: phosphoglycolate phosphatase [Geminicoccaceae bacterium]